jgi:hypothetical protein
MGTRTTKGRQQKRDHDMSKPTKNYTREEQEILDLVAKSRGQEMVDKFAHLILEQARAMGELAEEEDEPIVIDNGMSFRIRPNQHRGRRRLGRRVRRVSHLTTPASPPGPTCGHRVPGASGRRVVCGIP